MEPRQRLRSNRRLVYLIALLVLPPVALVIGPFHDVFFPRDPKELRAIVRIDLPPLDGAALRKLAGPDCKDEALLAELEHSLAEGQWMALVERIGQLTREQVTPGLTYLHGLAALLAERPALAVAGMETAKQSHDPELARNGKYGLAQALLLMGRSDAARTELLDLAKNEGPHQADAERQLAALDALR